MGRSWWNIPCSGWEWTRNSSEGWVSWEDPGWIHPKLFIPRVGLGLAGSWPVTAPFFWDGIPTAQPGTLHPPLHRIKHILIRFSLHALHKRMPAGTPGLLQLRAHPKPGTPGRAELRGRPGAAENAGALHVCRFHVRWFPRKPLALHVCGLTPCLLSFG